LLCILQDSTSTPHEITSTKGGGLGSFASRSLKKVFFLQLHPCSAMAMAGSLGSMAFLPAARIPARRTGLTPSIGPWKSTGQGSAGQVAEEQSGRRTRAAAVAAHRHSRRRGSEHGPRRGA
jgi:hypothetical protein